MQEGCEKIYQAVRHNTMYGKEACDELNVAKTAYAGRVFGPASRHHQGKWNIMFLFTGAMSMYYLTYLI